MYGKTVRRRRVLLAVLVVLSLILLTAYFGESAGGTLHAVQRGFLTITSPIQEGADKALKPVRDAFGWFGEVSHAKSQRDQLRKEVDKLRRKLIANDVEERRYLQLSKLYGLEQAVGLSAYKLLSATVVAQSSSLWYSTVDIDRGSSDGVQINDPVLDGEGLIGKVTQVASDGAQVSLITDSEVGVAARIAQSDQVGLIQPKVGDPGDLVLQLYARGIPNAAAGDLVVTSGTISGSGNGSLFPPNIPIGTVTSVDEGSPYDSINVRPAAQLRNLDLVRVVLDSRDSHLGRVAASIAKMPPGGNGSGSGSPPGTGYAEVGGQ